MSKPLKDQYKPIEKLDLKDLSKDTSKVFKKVNCPSCDSEVVADNINLNNATAKCGNCNSIFSIEGDIEDIKTKKSTATEILRPEGIDLFFYKDEMEITIQEKTKGWEALWAMILLFIGGFSIALHLKKPSTFAVALGIISLISMLYFIYEWVTYSKYRTFIDINQRQVNFKSRPKNIKKDKSFSSDEIDQLFVNNSADGMGHFTIHMLVNAPEGQKQVKLVTVNSLPKAKYIEQEIERYLGLEDRPITGAHYP